MNRKILILIIAAIVIIPIVVAIIYTTTPRATLTFLVAPTDATITVNDQKHTVKLGESITVTPGELTVAISRDEFETHTEKVIIKKDETQTLVVVLKPLTQAAQNLLESQENQQVIQRLTTNRMNAAAATATKEYPLIKILPINDKFYTILPCASAKYPDDTSKVAICIKLTDIEAKQSALDDITSRGYKLEDYEIIIIDNTYSPATDPTVEFD